MSSDASGLTCPKCLGALRSYARNGVTIDRCGECRRVFLDRGELKRLIDAVNAYVSGQPARVRAGAAEGFAPSQDWPGKCGGGGHHRRGRRGGGFLGELFD